MSELFPDVRVGEPEACGSLAVFPLFSAQSPLFEEESRSDYVLVDEAIEQGAVTVTEVSNDGMVGDLLVTNGGEMPVLLLDGSELRGGKQSRMLNTTVLVGSRSQVRVPVSCVEIGRWGDCWGQFNTGSHCPPSLRRIIKGGNGRGGRHVDQFDVWEQIRQKHRALGVSCKTGDMGAALEMHRKKVEQLRGQLPMSCM